MEDIPYSLFFCKLNLVYMESGGATLLVGTWQREKQE